MLTLSSQGQALIAAKLVMLAVLVEMDLSTPFYVCTGAQNLTVGGNSYQAVGAAGKIEPVQATPAEIRALQFQLSGVLPSAISMVLQTPIQGKAVRIKLALYDPSTYTVTDTILLWQGQLDTMRLEDGTDTTTIMVSAEHVGIDLNRPVSAYFTDADQQALFPGDLFFQYVSTQFDQRIVWPAAHFFHK